jgi:hypothetical protein
MGVYFGESAMLMRDKSNEKGYFERFQVNEVQDYILRINGFSWVKLSDFYVDCLGEKSQHIFDSGMKSFFDECHEKSIWGVKDPRTCLTFPLWKKHLEQPVCIFVFRNPCHVAMSLKKRDGFSLEFGLALWEKYNVIGLSNIIGLPTLLTDFDALTTEPDIAAEKLYTELTALGSGGIHMLDTNEINSLVDRKLVHHHEENDEHGCEVTNYQKNLYEEMKAGVISKESFRMSVSSKTNEVLKGYEDVIVYGTKESVVNQKLVDMIDGERKLVLNIGTVASRVEESLNGRLPYSGVVNVRFATSLKNDSHGEDVFLVQDQEGAMEFIKRATGDIKPDLLILNRIIFKLESPVEMLVKLKEILAPGAQVLVLDKNPKNIVTMNKLLEHDVWQSSTGSTFDYQDKGVMTKQELVRIFTVSGYQMVSSDYNIDSRLEKLYVQGLQQNNTPDLHMDKYVLKKVTKNELKELCSNFMFLELLNA